MVPGNRLRADAIAKRVKYGFHRAVAVFDIGKGPVPESLIVDGHGRSAAQTGSQVKTSWARSRGKNDSLSAAMASSAMLCGAQPSPLRIERAGRGALITKHSFVRTAKIAPVTSFASS